MHIFEYLYPDHIVKIDERLKAGETEIDNDKRIVFLSKERYDELRTYDKVHFEHP